MKADIPDKILINRGEDGRLHHSYWTTDQQLVPFEDTLYIRKDALLEWIKDTRKAINECTATDERKVAALSVIEALTKRLNSL